MQNPRITGNNALQIAALFSILYCVPGYTTTMKAYAMEELVAESDLVVLGRAVEIKHRRNARGKIGRKVALKVDRYLVGSGPSRIHLHLSGGTIGNIRTRVVGEVTLAAHEPVLLFLRRSSEMDEPVYYIVGMTLGCFRVLTDGRTGMRFITQVIGGGLHLVDEVQDDSMGIGRSGVCIFVELERFVSRIRTLTGTREAAAGE